MFSVKPRKLALTLLFSVALALALAGTSEANGSAVQRRDHTGLNRMIKKRTPFPADATQNGGGVAVGVEQGPPSVSQSASASSVVSSAAASSSVAPSSQPASSAASSSASSSAPASSSSPASSTESSSVSSSATSSTPSSAPPSITPSASPTSTPPTPTETPSADQQSLNPTIATATFITHVPGASDAASSDTPVQPQSSSSLSHTALTIIIVLASCIGGTAIIWTIIRKWKFRPSTRFEDRLEPIDWQPAAEHDTGLPTHRRGPSNASSFHSSGHEGGAALSRGNSYGATSDGRAPGTTTLNPIPDHDFTAGAPSLAPVGGYADLARGPSPQPQMQEALTRGPSVTRNYDSYGVPLHHQGGYNGDAYDYNGAPRY
ncbi:hypothetical protein FA95DRAFT_1079943 [Auriscalpium vulgare]|uniref:Uncharacterized protein n=1 Tax=Auriscalpium vulgare TaxID=40419 RepID=A0ACB8RWH8_9AGAM|nr:hypothetical protein FA95DRAFT_1079943 [Auriscalpium vulgare]